MAALSWMIYQSKPSDDMAVIESWTSIACVLSALPARTILSYLESVYLA